jgi:excisionase family DNA binding protein
VARNVTGPQVEYLTVPEIAERAKVARGTVYRWFDEGRLTKYKTPAGRVLAEAAEVDRLTTPRIVRVQAASPAATGTES